jgi:lipopolysaccharide/colanic/teichoic acid biosynthesis glycosyltransferase
MNTIYYPKKIETLSSGKRIFDFLFSLLGYFLLSPLLLAISAAIRIQMGAPVFFTQVRPGLNGVPFKLYKFRTMKNNRDKQGQFLPDEKRLTPLGRWLRTTSLDELPELINILNGDMSVVGPRPLLMQYLDRYSPEQARRHEVKPGLTGWAQINGRNAISWEEKFKLDVWYVDNQSLWLDISIIALTVKHVLKREGISFEGEATMHEFMGHAKPQRR